jgi:flagellar FliL protein
MEEERDDMNENARRGGVAGIALALLGLTLVGGGAGGGFAALQVDRIEAVAERRANETPAKREGALAWDEATAVARLDPVITNLARPAGTFVRLDAAMVFDRDAVSDVERMKATVSQDILAFMRTVSIGELQGASAFNHLRDDLNDRVAVTSDGLVRELVIETMVLQ